MFPFAELIFLEVFYHPSVLTLIFQFLYLFAFPLTVGFEVGLIQEQIDRIIEREGTEDIGIKTSGLGVFLQSIKYRYYPIFMIVLMVGLIYSRREYGSMLIAERKTQVYKRTDGG